MIRLLIDKLGSGHKDLFLKIDAMPNSLFVADSYYLFDFVKATKNDVSVADIALQLLDYWTEKMVSIKKGDIQFLPFDLCDEYIGGFEITKTKLGYKIKRVFTDKIAVFEVDSATLDAVIATKKVTYSYDENETWLLSETALQEGFEWSIQELKK
jgi:hypothetical protein